MSGMRNSSAGRDGERCDDTGVLEGFEGDLQREVKGIVEAAKRLQVTCGENGRLHVLYEVLESGMRTRGRTEISMNEMRVLFSDSIKFSGGDEYANASCRLAASVALFGLLHSERECDNGSKRIAANDGGSINSFCVPSWYPGNEYVDGVQISPSQFLIVSAEHVKVTAHLSDEQVAIVYNMFFQRLHELFIEKDGSLPHGRMKYSRFTAPWIRLKMSFRDEVVVLEQAVMPRPRQQRSSSGYRKLRWLLAAFLDHEHEKFRSVLDMCITAHVRSLNLSQNVQCNSTNEDAVNRLAESDEGDIVDLTGSALNHGSVTGDERTAQGKSALLLPTLQTVSHERRPQRRTIRLDNGLVSAPVRTDPLPVHHKDTVNVGKRRKILFKLVLSSVVGMRGIDRQESEQGEVIRRDVSGQSTVEREQPVTVNCARGSTCRFKLDIGAQDIENISGRCAECKRPLHDLCGRGPGNEGGRMVCGVTFCMRSSQ